MIDNTISPFPLHVSPQIANSEAVLFQILYLSTVLGEIVKKMVTNKTSNILYIYMLGEHKHLVKNGHSPYLLLTISDELQHTEQMNNMQLSLYI